MREGEEGEGRGMERSRRGVSPADFPSPVQRSQRVMVTPLHQLLLGINPRTGKADNLVNVARYLLIRLSAILPVCLRPPLSLLSRYVALSDCTPELALVAVRVLYWVSKFPKAAKELFTAITSDKV